MKPKKLAEDFFTRNSQKVASELIGRYLARFLEGQVYRFQIFETGAYNGEVSRKLPGLNYLPGRLYIPTFFGKKTLAISTSSDKEPSVVTIRKVESMDINELCKQLEIDKNFNDKSIYGDQLWIEGDMIENVKFIKKERGMSANCLGYYRLRE